jgi:hypothetical protein
MTTTADIVDTEQEESILMKNMAKIPHGPSVEEKNRSLPYPKEELLTLEEFDEFLKDTMHERFGVILDLSPENLASFE